MPTQIAAIQPRRKDWRTQSNADWLDSMLVWQAGTSGIVAGTANAGNGSLTVSAVDPSTTLGAHIIRITSTAGVTRFTVEDPAGFASGSGVVGLPCYAGGLTFMISAGSQPFVVGDTFAVAALQVPIDITGLRFILQARTSRTSASIALSADSAPGGDIDPTIAVGGTSGSIAMYLFAEESMASDKFAPGTYVYDIVAYDPESNRRVVAFFGTIEHSSGAAYIP